MLITKERLSTILTNECRKFINDKEKIRTHVKDLNQKFEIPEEKATDLLTLREDFLYEPVEVLYAVATILKPNALHKYFKEEELVRYNHYVYPRRKKIFPLTLPAIQIEDSQWISKIDVTNLMRLRDTGIIRYNENTQRQLTRVRKGEVEYYRITVNQKAVREIQELILRGDYIPDPLTFNLPLDYDVEYNEEERSLRIPEVPYIDILDGYHRYLALSGLYNLKKIKDFTMEMRIVQFPEPTAQQFIWQQDQKTKLQKSDSASLNQNNIGNQVAARLDADRTCELFNQIKRNGGLIDFATLAQVINVYYKKQKNVTVRKVSSDIGTMINKMVDEDETLVTKKWSYKMVVVLVHKVMYDGETKNLLGRLEENQMSLSRPVTNTIIEKLRKEDSYV